MPEICVFLQTPLKFDVYGCKGDIFTDLGPAVNRQPLFTPDVTRRASMAAISLIAAHYSAKF